MDCFVEIHLIRHTPPDIQPGVCYGQTDLSLAKDYLQEFHKILNRIDLTNSAIYSSPLQRCLQLAEFLLQNGEPPLLNPTQDSKIFQDSRIQELNFGQWEMKPWDEIPREELDPWAEDYVNIAPPQGESLYTMRTRVLDFIQELPDTKNILVTHAGVIRILWAHWHQRPMQDAFEQKIEFGQICSFIDKTGPQF